VYGWFESLENYLALSSIHPDHWLMTAFSLMVPPASSYYLSVRDRVLLLPLLPLVGLEDCLTVTQLLVKSPQWQGLKQSFVRAFGSAGLEHSARIRLDHLTQTGTAERYIREFCQIESQIIAQPLSEGDKVYRFLKGLKPALRAQAHFVPGTTESLDNLGSCVEIVARLAAVMEAVESPPSSKRELAAAMGIPLKAKKQRSDGASGSGDGAQAGPQGGQAGVVADAPRFPREAKRVPDPERKRRLDNRLCLKCGEAGHRVDSPLCKAADYLDGAGKVCPPLPPYKGK
jgi:hypothetical protein